MTHLMIRLLVVVTIAAAALSGANRLTDGDGDHADAIKPTATSAPIAEPTPSRANQARAEPDDDATETIVRYNLAANEALILRMSSDGMSSCAFRVRLGPDLGTERVAPGIEVTHRIVPRSMWREDMAQLAMACDQYWLTIHS